MILELLNYFRNMDLLFSCLFVSYRIFAYELVQGATWVRYRNSAGRVRERRLLGRLHKYSNIPNSISFYIKAYSNCRGFLKELTLDFTSASKIIKCRPRLLFKAEYALTQYENIHLFSA